MWSRFHIFENASCTQVSTTEETKRIPDQSYSFAPSVLEKATASGQGSRVWGLRSTDPLRPGRLPLRPQGELLDSRKDSRSTGKSADTGGVHRGGRWIHQKRLGTKLLPVWLDGWNIGTTLDQWKIIAVGWRWCCESLLWWEHLFWLFRMGQCFLYIHGADACGPRLSHSRAKNSRQTFVWVMTIWCLNKIKSWWPFTIKVGKWDTIVSSKSKIIKS